jgi:hypothetical protein
MANKEAVREVVEAVRRERGYPADTRKAGNVLLHVVLPGSVVEARDCKVRPYYRHPDPTRSWVVGKLEHHHVTALTGAEPRGDPDDTSVRMEFVHHASRIVDAVLAGSSPDEPRPPVQFEITEPIVFPPPPGEVYSCVVLGVSTEPPSVLADLHCALNSAIACTTRFMSFKAHITIAYLSSAEAAEELSQDLRVALASGDRKAVLTDIQYSTGPDNYPSN